MSLMAGWTELLGRVLSAAFKVSYKRETHLEGSPYPIPVVTFGSLIVLLLAFLILVLSPSKSSHCCQWHLAHAALNQLQQKQTQTPIH